MQHLLLERFERYDDSWWPVVTAVCVMGAGLFGLCVIGNLIIQQAIVWGDAYVMLILGAVALAARRRSIGRPTFERRLVLDQNRISLIEELINPADQRVIQQTIESIECGIGSGITFIASDDGAPTCVEIWGTSTVGDDTGIAANRTLGDSIHRLRVSASERVIQEVFQVVTAWLERRTPIAAVTTSGDSTATEKPRSEQPQRHDDSWFEAVNELVRSVSDSKYVRAEWWPKHPTEIPESEESLNLRLRIAPDPSQARDSNHIVMLMRLIGLALLAATRFMANPSPLLWIGGSASLLAALAIGIKQSLETHEIVELQLSSAELVIIRTYGDWQRQRVVEIQIPLEVGFLKDFEDSEEIVPNVCLMIGRKCFRFGANQTNDVKRQLVQLLRAYWKLDTRSNLFLR